MLIFAEAKKEYEVKSDCFSVAKSCLTLCDPIYCNMSGFPVLHYLLEFAQIHVRWVKDPI